MKIPLRPINKTVIIKELEKEQQTPGGIILLPDADVEEVVEAGEVVAVAKDIENDIKVGDIVYYCKYNPQDLKLKVDGKEITLFVAPEKDIMGVYGAQKG